MWSTAKLMSTVLFQYLHTTCCSGSTWGPLHSQLCEVVSQTAVGDVMGSVGEADCEEFFQYYLHDFVRSVHRCYYKQQKSKDLEYKVGLRMIHGKCIIPFLHAYIHAWTHVCRTHRRSCIHTHMHKYSHASSVRIDYTVVLLRFMFFPQSCKEHP